MSTPPDRLEDGSPCPDEDCDGTLEFVTPDDCSCHLSAPCGPCTDRGLKCNGCGERPGDA